MRPYQTRIESFIEVSINIALGFVVSFMVWLYLIPTLYPHHQSNFFESIGIVSIFTIASIARSYIVRRFFERHLHRLSQLIAKELS